MKKIMMFIFAALIACSGGGGGSEPALPPVSSTDHIEYMGYYWGASQAYGNFIDDFYDYTNMVNIYITGDWDKNIKMIEHAISKGLAPLPYFAAWNVWLDSNWNRRVHPDQCFWDTFVEKMSPYVKHFAGFYVFDEPYAYGISTNTQDWVLSYYRKAFPDSLLWATFVNHDRRLPGVAYEYDVVSVTPWYNEIDSAGYEYDISKLKPLLHPHQRIAITMDCYYPHPLISNHTERWKANQAWEYFELAKKDPLVIALYMFIYPSFRDDVLGVEDMPVLEDTLIDIWRTTMRHVIITCPNCKKKLKFQTAPKSFWCEHCHRAFDEKNKDIMTDIDFQQLKFVDKRLRELVVWLERNTGQTYTITSLYRIGDTGVHGQMPVRGVDLRCRNRQVGKEIENLINLNWKYDTSRPKKQCAFLHGTGTNCIYICKHTTTPSKSGFK